MYDLYAVVNHRGELQGGHYTAYVLDNQKQWLLFDDETVSVVYNKESIVSTNAYVLFYKLRN